MGAEQFDNSGSGKNAKEVFEKLVEQALWDHGHSGYTGTIGEKSDFAEVEVPDGLTPKTFIAAVNEYREPFDNTQTNYSSSQLAAIKAAHKIADNKWGPAVCVKTGPKEWTFFGWASS